MKNQKDVIKINLVLPLDDTILKSPEATKALNEVFEDNREEIKEQITKILNFLETEGIMLAYKDVARKFRLAFYKSILSKAIKTAVTNNSEKPIIKANLMREISDNSIADALYGQILLHAFASEIQQTNQITDSSLRDLLINQINNKFFLNI